MQQFKRSGNTWIVSTSGVDGENGVAGQAYRSVPEIGQPGRTGHSASSSTPGRHADSISLLLQMIEDSSGQQSQNVVVVAQAPGGFQDTSGGGGSSVRSACCQNAPYGCREHQFMITVNHKTNYDSVESKLQAITVNACGGKGGDGADGGLGQNGGQGSKGKDAVFYAHNSVYNKKGENGTNGARGGNGGLPSSGCDGGDAGSITIRFTRDSMFLLGYFHNQLPRAKGGAGSEAGKPGRGGQGGAGGDGGHSHAYTLSVPYEYETKDAAGLVTKHTGYRQENHAVPGGDAGNYGSTGDSGSSANCHSGHCGKDREVTFELLDPPQEQQIRNGGSTMIYLDIFRAKVLGFELQYESKSNICEPGERITLHHARVVNNGGAPFPHEHDIVLKLAPESKYELVGETVIRCPRGLSPAANFTSDMQDGLRFQAPNQIGKHFIHLEPVLPALRASIHTCTDTKLCTKEIDVRHAVVLDEIKLPDNVQPGGSCAFALRLRNQSNHVLGQEASRRRVRYVISLASDSQVSGSDIRYRHVDEKGEFRDFSEPLIRNIARLEPLSDLVELYELQWDEKVAAYKKAVFQVQLFLDPLYSTVCSIESALPQPSAPGHRNDGENEPGNEGDDVPPPAYTEQVEGAIKQPLEEEDVAPMREIRSTRMTVNVSSRSLSDVANKHSHEPLFNTQLHVLLVTNSSTTHEEFEAWHELVVGKWRLKLGTWDLSANGHLQLHWPLLAQCTVILLNHAKLPPEMKVAPLEFLDVSEFHVAAQLHQIRMLIVRDRYAPFNFDMIPNLPYTDGGNACVTEVTDVLKVLKSDVNTVVDYVVDIADQWFQSFRADIDDNMKTATEMVKGELLKQFPHHSFQFLRNHHSKTRGIVQIQVIWDHMARTITEQAILYNDRRYVQCPVMRNQVAKCFSRRLQYLLWQSTVAPAALISTMQHIIERDILFELYHALKDSDHQASWTESEVLETATLEQAFGLRILHQLLRECGTTNQLPQRIMLTNFVNGVYRQMMKMITEHTTKVDSCVSWLWTRQRMMIRQGIKRGWCTAFGNAAAVLVHDPNDSKKYVLPNFAHHHLPLYKADEDTLNDTSRNQIACPDTGLSSYNEMHVVGPRGITKMTTTGNAQLLPDAGRLVQLASNMPEINHTRYHCEHLKMKRHKLEQAYIIVTKQ